MCRDDRRFSGVRIARSRQPWPRPNPRRWLCGSFADYILLGQSLEEIAMDNRRRMDIPDRRKNTYESLEIKVHEYFEEVETRLNQFFIKALFIFATISITSAVALLGFGILLGDQRETNDKLKDQVQTNRLLSLAIQNQRRNFIFENCRDQNRRNRDAKKALPDQSLLIDTLIPIQNCRQAVKDGLKGG